MKTRHAHWSLFEAIAWIMIRDENELALARSLLDLHILAGLAQWTAKQRDKQAVVAPLLLTVDEAFEALHCALRLGDIVAQGRPPGADDLMQIPTAEWHDLQIGEQPSGFSSAKRIATGRGVYEAVRVSAAAARKIWPAPRAITRKRGPRPIVTNAARARMIDDLESGGVLAADLEQMKGLALAAQYGGSRNTAVDARKAALSEFRAGRNPDNL